MLNIFYKFNSCELFAAYLKNILMKNLLLLLVLIPGFLSAQLHGIEINTAIPSPDVKMHSINGTDYSLNDLVQENGLLVIFTSNTCPFVKVWELEYPELYKLASDNKIGMVLINSNEKFRGTTESLSEMKKIAKEFNYEMIPQLVDVNSKLAGEFDANTTPHVFLFNGDSKLAFRGSIDDRYENPEKNITKKYLKSAILSLSKGELPEINTSRNFGCSIKRK